MFQLLETTKYLRWTEQQGYQKWKKKSGVKMECETTIKAHKGSHHSEKSWKTRGRMSEMTLMLEKTTHIESPNIIQQP